MNSITRLLKFGLMATVLFAYTHAKANTNKIEGILSQPGNVLFTDISGSSQSIMLSVYSIQGIVNANKPVLFVQETPYEKRWLKALNEHYGFTCHQVSPDALIDYYSEKIGKQVIYDPKIECTVNIATSAAAISKAIITDRDLGIKTTLDCRGKWLSKQEANQWAIDNLLPKCKMTGLGYLGCELNASRDFLIKQGIFTISLDPLNDPVEIKMLNKLLAKYPELTMIYGYASEAHANPDKRQDHVSVEHALVSILSKNNHFLVCTDYARNLSFFDSIQSKGQIKQSLPAPPAFDQNKSYVALIMSDGDNVQFNLNHMRKLWLEDGRSQLPIGWTVSPQMVRLAPSILEIYYQEAAGTKTDEFICGPSGYGYVNPGAMKSEMLDKFCALTADICQKADLGSVVVLDKANRPDKKVKEFVASYAKHGIDGLWLAEFHGKTFIQDKTAVLSEDGRLSHCPAKAASKINKAAKSKRFLMVYLHAWDVDISTIQEMINRLEPAVQVVLPAQLLALYKGHADKIDE